jgi:hypothetical protein
VYCILEAYCALDHEVGAVLTDAAIHNNSVGLCGIGVLSHEALALLAFKKEPFGSCSL